MVVTGFDAIMHPLTCLCVKQKCKVYRKWQTSAEQGQEFRKYLICHLGPLILKTADHLWQPHLLEEGTADNSVQDRQTSSRGIYEYWDRGLDNTYLPQTKSLKVAEGSSPNNFAIWLSPEDVERSRSIFPGLWRMALSWSKVPSTKHSRLGSLYYIQGSWSITTMRPGGGWIWRKEKLWGWVTSLQGSLPS